MIQLISRWGKEIDPGNILQEYPRPNLVRDSYFNLNGEWECRINESETADFYDETIIVPFSPESMLSGVGKIVMPHQRLHYRKKFTLPEGFKKSRVLLHFGAVDQECSVFVNGIRVGGHKGGYLPFHFDITDSLRQGENVLTLSVTDRTEQSPHARGKQKLQKKGKYASLFYTPQSGIWKTVWMESVEKAYIEDVRITPLYDDSSVRFEITVLNACKTSGAETSGGKASGGETSGTVRLAVLERGVEIGQAEITVRQEKEIKQVISQEIKLDGFKPWTPDTPHLYDVIIRYGEDEVRSYFGMRKLSTGRDGKGILRFFLNNKPYFFNGILDQGYWPESLMTAPSDEALVYDIIKLKEMGYNTIRKHVKIEAERFYYHCDRLGMMVWQDMPNGGGEYNMVFVTHLPNASDRFARGVSDRHYGIFKRKDGEGRRQYYTDLKNMVSTLYNYPSIAVWVPFNEGWGQFDAAKATKEVREIDSGRLINEACGWFDQGGGDMYSIHNYRHKLKVKPQQDRVVALTEYGGYAYPVEEHLSCKKEFGYQHYHSTEELTQNYKRLWEEEIYPNLQYGLCSAIYTQTSDIEEEINGVLTYDREIVKLDEEQVKEMNDKLYGMFDSLV
ncbi:glycoside hydrolase family 2 protein [[Clostridium] symbiosum]|uniref:glycoside hydrolase family 2 protein n=1 Tax=Clostridium symbiosum TaxID=1512 RepID=UPI00232EABC6|nr:sugar-binding domain-containing protein [[Clostridium] symbiosum]MDB2009966.1 glycoside hydrolase family 2 TIM barrel-domain containing protein [[Clostridium] symbiosum]MDB2027327.1 glycoside hydrolase family 2 TIM barrel-domain containing protein [[Clostridium] symbiosum]